MRAHALQMVNLRYCSPARSCTDMAFWHGLGEEYGQPWDKDAYLLGLEKGKLGNQ